MGRKLEIGRWTFQKRPRGFEIEWYAPDGRNITTYPRISDHIRFHWIFYPYVLWKSIQAIQEQRKYVWEPTRASND